MRWLVSLLLIGGSSFFLYTRFKAQGAPALPAPISAAPAAADSRPFLSTEELKSVLKSARDAQPGVRWSALELLFTLRHPSSVKLLERAITEDPDPELRMKAIKLMSSVPNPDRVPALVRGISDTDKDVRVASLKALGEMADASASPWIVGALRDPEPEVKQAALKALGLLHEKRKAQFKELSDRLRVQYETAVKKAQKERESAP